MLEAKLGFIGAGNLAEAIIGGVIAAGVADPQNIHIYDKARERLDLFAEKFGISTAQTSVAVAEQADLLFLSVKPNVYDIVIAEIAGAVKPGATVIILAAGLNIESVKQKFGNYADGLEFVKVMPNTPAMVGAGVTAVSDPLENVLTIFNSVGKTVTLPEPQFDIFTALAASSPAYVYTFIEAMADAGVKHGLSRQQAIDISCQAVLGAARLVQESGKHPAELRDAVCSPSGTTIAAVCELEKQGFRNAVIQAVSACVDRYNAIDLF